MNFHETLGRHLLAIETRGLVDAHRGWFERKDWTLSAKPVEIEKRGGEWLMVQDQNTPIQARDC